jgi:hypothetical protein
MGLTGEPSRSFKRQIETQQLHGVLLARPAGQKARKSDKNTFHCARSPVRRRAAAMRCHLEQQAFTVIGGMRHPSGCSGVI